MTAILHRPMSSETLHTPHEWGNMSEAWARPSGWQPADTSYACRSWIRPSEKEKPYVEDYATRFASQQELSTQNGQRKQPENPTQRPIQPSEDVSPKNVQQIKVEFKQEPDMYQADSTDEIASYLQIPPEINSSKGSLSDFAARITCLFWFESPQTLAKVEEPRPSPLSIQPLCREADPTMGFRKWVTTMLSTTQVSTNVVLLALMFVYRLKKMNAAVRGKPGSEYRLLTVALMLGNKFLDDNTYTNKTWAEVSGITVKEIHVMEVEFLSNMRYNLYASKETWGLWVKKLGRFAEYFDAASKVAETQAASMAEAMSPAYHSPNNGFAQPLAAARSYTNTVPISVPAARLPHPLAMPIYPDQILAGPPSRLPEVSTQQAPRKRSYDESADERPSKRVSRHFGLEAIPDTSSPTSHSGNAYPDMSRPMYPNIRGGNAYDNPPRGLPPLPVQATMAPTILPQLPISYPQLPQTRPGRAMASVYPPISQSGMDALKPQPQLPQLGLRIPPLMDPGQSLSATGSRNSSPMTANVVTPSTNEQLSPMVYGNFRSSPYKPVRSVNHLLAPPPSSSLGLPANGMGSSDLQYRPLMKQPGQNRTGVVPHIHDPYSYQHDPYSQQGNPYTPRPDPHTQQPSWHMHQPREY